MKPSRTSASLAATDWPLGPYLITISGWDDVMEFDVRVEHVVDLAHAETLYMHLGNAIREVRQRQVVDGRRQPPRLDRPGHPMAPGRRHRGDDRTGVTMTARGDLFAAGEEARDAAVNAVSDNADIDWLDVTERIIRRLPRGETFTTDDAWAALAETTAATHEPRAMGAVVRKLARAGVLLPTGQYRPSVRRECHARPIPVWRRSADDPHYREETP